MKFRSVSLTAAASGRNDHLWTKKRYIYVLVWYRMNSLSDKGHVFPCHNNSDIKTLNLKSRKEQGHAVFSMFQNLSTFLCVSFLMCLQA